MRSKKVILDTNLWISFLISKDYSFIDKFVKNQKLRLVFSNELIHEFLAVATRPKFQKYFTDQDIQQLLRALEKFAIFVEVNSAIELCRDYKDNFLLNLAVDSKADFLVTGDRDLLELKKIGNAKILTFRELEKKLDKI